jgi:RNA polymerase sigma-70 factor (sigma-E family)
MGRERFDEFAASSATRLCRAAYLLVGDHHLAEDLTQDVLARVYVAWPRITGDPYGYAYRAMGNAAANQRRWIGRHPETPVPDTSRDQAVPDAADGIVAHADLMAALGQLPARQRAVVVLRYFLDLTEADTAQALDISVGTVKSQHARAVEHLRDLLGVDLVAPNDGDLVAPGHDGSTT